MDSDNLHRRIKKIIGQLNAIDRMIDEDIPCEQILMQVNASKSAQFLFTSHNTNLLDIKKMRRDQILFTNKKEDGSTEVYSLFDFKDFRENMDAEKCYLPGRFDAVPYIYSSISVIKNLLGE